MAGTIIRTGRRTATKGVKGYAAVRTAQRAGRMARRSAGKRIAAVHPARRVAVAAGSAGVAGAAGVYFLDPSRGARRRNMARDRAFALVRRGRHEAERKAEYAAGHAKGAVHDARTQVAGERQNPEMTGQDLARKVESIVFRDGELPKGQVNLDANGRTVALRGQVDSQEQIDELVRRTNDVPEVEVVDNLLHLPGQPAPTRADTPPDQRA
jgi:osmotically-inducible protein OsmY